MNDFKPYYEIMRYRGAPGNRWILKHFDSRVDFWDAGFVIDRYRTREAAMRGMIKDLRRGVANLAMYKNDPRWKELGDRYRRMKAQLEKLGG